MHISEKHLNEFKELLKNKMGQEAFSKLSEQDILDRAIKLLTMVKIVYKPITKKDFDWAQKKIQELQDKEEQRNAQKDKK
jgi:hypothetical protein